MNNRRKLIYAIGACALTVPIFAPAQQQKLWRIGVLNLDSENYDALRQGMRELGYHEGKNVRYETRYAEGSYERLPAFASELVALKVDVIVSTATVATRAAQQATKSIPIVMIGVGNPIGEGFIASLARPGGNITGVTNLASELVLKRLELIETLPGVTRVAVLRNSDNLSSAGPQRLVAAAKKLGVAVLFFDARNPEEIDRALASMVRDRADALLVQNDPVFTSHRQRISGAATNARLPAIYGNSRFVEDGGLLSYGPNVRGYFR